jgi:hypothetical protein
MKIEIQKLTDIGHAKEGIEFSLKGFESKLQNLSKLYASEHSPACSQLYIIKLYDIPYYVHTHIRTHKHNFIFESVTSNRPDITGIKRSTEDSVNMIIYITAKNLIYMMLVRLCHKAMQETREIFELIKLELINQNDCLEAFCVPKCVYRNGLCGEFKCCGFNRTEKYFSIQKNYNSFFK